MESLRAVAVPGLQPLTVRDPLRLCDNLAVLRAVRIAGLGRTSWHARCWAGVEAEGCLTLCCELSC
jgi:hypothetical protein